ncbi:MAG: hypothetical protein WAM39_13620 [Bryobacteraceae bacterium]
MATSPITVQSTQLTTSAATVLTSPAGFWTTTKKVTASNVSSSAVTVTVYKVASGGSAGSTNTLIYQKTIPPNSINGGVVELYEAENQTLAPGDTLQALCSAATSLNINISAIEQTT